MRYKTKKYIKKSLLYTLNIFLLSTFYIISAHKFYLPALFEYYTGAFVRKNTNTYFEKYAPLLGLNASSPGSGGVGFMNVLDFLSREPTYLYISDILGTLDAGHKTQKNLPSVKIRDEVISVVTHPALIEWIKNPYGEFAPVYQYEVIRYIDVMATIRDYAILANDKKEIYNNGNLTAKNDFSSGNTELEYDHGMVSIPIRSNGERIGRFLAQTGDFVPSELNFENTGIQINYFILLKGDKISKKNVLDIQLQKWIHNDTYSGPSRGLHDGFRFIEKVFPEYRLLIVYKGESAWYYVLKITIYVIFLLFSGLVFYFLKNKNWIEFFRRSGKINLDELLTRNTEMNREYVSLSRKYQESLKDMKVQEVERLRLISEHLGYFHQTLYKSLNQDAHELKIPE